MKGKPFLQVDPVSTYDFPTAQKELNELIKFVASEKKKFEAKAKKETVEKILILACLHVPLHSAKNLVRAVEWAVDKGVTTLIIAGDLLDCLSMGHAGYRRNIRGHQYMTLKDELAEGAVILKYLAENFAKIVLMRGNHVDRVRKFMCERVGPEMMFLVNHDPLTLLAANHKNIHIVNTEDKYGNDLSWIYQIGDMRVCHAEVGSSIELRPTIKLDKWFENWESFLRMQPYRVLVENHTHQGGIIPVNNGTKLLIEGLCMCKSQQYSLEPTIKYSRPQVNGVTYIEQENGVTDINSVIQYKFEGQE